MSKKLFTHNDILTEWQERLGLTDWIIVLHDNCNKEDMQLEDVAGETEYTKTNKTAVIRILDEKEYGDRITPFDYEKTLVHELLHLKLAVFMREDNTYEGNVLYDMLHQTLDDIAKALVLAKRNKRGFNNE